MAATQNFSWKRGRYKDKSLTPPSRFTPAEIFLVSISKRLQGKSTCTAQVCSPELAHLLISPPRGVVPLSRPEVRNVCPLCFQTTDQHILPTVTRPTNFPTLFLMSSTALPSPILFVGLGPHGSCLLDTYVQEGRVVHLPYSGWNHTSVRSSSPYPQACFPTSRHACYVSSEGSSTPHLPRHSVTGCGQSQRNAWIVNSYLASGRGQS